MSRYAVAQGDIIAWCKEHALKIERGEAEPFHAVFCDWPYLIDFLGKGARDAPHRLYLKSHRDEVEALMRLLGVDDWEAAAILWYRDVARGLASVCYPGAQHMGFGGARTDDLLAVGLRAAGWIVQDKLMYMYGSGMPHGLDIARAIDERRTEDMPAIYAVTKFVREGRERAGMTNAQIDDHFGLRGMAGHWTSAASQPAVPKPDQWEELKTLLNLGDEMDAEVARLNARKGEAGDNFKAREVLEVRKDGNQRRVPIMTSKSETYNVTAPHSPEAVAWHGWHTHLKPSYETLVYAYLPPEGTFAATALAYGTTGLHIDGSRVAGVKWPANVALEHMAGCELLGVREEDGGEIVELWSCAEGCPAGQLTAQLGGDPEAGASRFFYTVKPSEWERNFGLEDGDQHLQRRVNPGGLEREPRFAPKLAYNPHPTLKSIKALIYFAGLLRRPAPVDARLLVPFCGSGSEAIGAVLAGWPFVQGVELDQDAEHPGIFVDVAERRLAAWSQFGSYEEVADFVRQGRAIERALPPPELRLVELPKPTAPAAKPPRKTARPAIVYNQGSIFDMAPPAEPHTGTDG